MDSSSEELLKIILNEYDGNDDFVVHVRTTKLPRRFSISLNEELDKLIDYNVIMSNPFMALGSFSVYLTDEGVQYFKNKENANTKQSSDIVRIKSNNHKKYDVFISHANKDKSDFVDELYLAIRKLGINIFYDSEILSWGDNWKQVILDGTEKSEFAIIVISNNFFDREWTERELDEFLKRQNESGQKIVLPLLHNISLEKLKEKYPTLGDIQVIDTQRYSKEDITILFAKELIKRYKT